MANILVYGDSIGQGYYDKDGGWVDRLKRYFLEQEIAHNWKQGINVFNLSVSGDTTQDILTRIQKETKPRVWVDHKTLFIFAVGMNDSVIIDKKEKVSPAEFKSNLKKIVKYAGKYSGEILFLGLTRVEEAKVTPMPWSVNEYWYNKNIKKYNSELQKFCNNNNVNYLHLFDKLSPEHLFDGAHPNTKGHELIFKSVNNFLKRKSMFD